MGRNPWQVILVPRGRAPFGQHQESRPLAVSNTPSLCGCSESSLTNLIDSGLNLLCFQIHSKPECLWSRFLVLTKRSAASGDENGGKPKNVCIVGYYRPSPRVCPRASRPQDLARPFLCHARRTKPSRTTN